MGEQRIALSMLKTSPRMLCYAAKYVGEKEVYFRSEWEYGGRLRMLNGLWELIANADATLTYNGDRFDLPKILGEFVLAKLPPPPPVASIDLLKTVKKLGLICNKLAFVSPLLGHGNKIETDFSLWTDVMAGKADAWAKMKRYNIQDVKLLEKDYKTLRPYMTNHPYLHSKAGCCPNCGSNKTQARGQRRTRSFWIDRIHCQACGAWSQGTRRKVG